MNILVYVKHVVDSTEVRVDKKSGELVLQGIPTKINDYDKNAIEEAIRIKKEANGHVTLLTVGPKEALKTVKEGLAMGADIAYIVDDKSVTGSDPLEMSRILAQATDKLGAFDIMISGAVSEDMGNSITSVCVAERLNVPHIAYVNKVELNNDHVVVERRMNEVIETIKAQLPVLITVDRTINSPRLPSAIQIMKVKSNRIHKLDLDDLELNSIKENIKLQGYSVVESNRKNIIFENDSSIDELVKQLAEEGVLS